MIDKTIDAWMTDDGRVISARQKETALKDGGASASSVHPYSIPLTRHLSQPAERGDEKPLAFCRVEDVYDNDSMLRQMGVKRGDFLYTAPPPAAGVPDMVKIGAPAWPGQLDGLPPPDGWSMLSATPSPTIDVVAVREVIAECRRPMPKGRASSMYMDGYNDALNDVADKLSEIIGESHED